MLLSKTVKHTSFRYINFLCGIRIERERKKRLISVFENIDIFLKIFYCIGLDMFSPIYPIEREKYPFLKNS